MRNQRDVAPAPEGSPPPQRGASRASRPPRDPVGPARVRPGRPGRNPGAPPSRSKRGTPLRRRVQPDSGARRWPVAFCTRGQAPEGTLPPFARGSLAPSDGPSRRRGRRTPPPAPTRSRILGLDRGISHTRVEVKSATGSHPSFTRSAGTNVGASRGMKKGLCVRGRGPLEGRPRGRDLRAGSGFGPHGRGILQELV